MKIPSHDDIVKRMGNVPQSKEALIELIAAFFAQFADYSQVELKGDKGDSPTKEELIALITPLIPDPIKGDQGDPPTKEELAQLILSLVPSLKGEPGDNGSSPTEKELLKLIKPLIPKKAEDGKSPTEKELIALIKPLLPDGKSFQKQIDALEKKIDDAEKKRKKTVAGKAGGGLNYEGTHKITVSATAPVGPQVGDLWVDIS